MRDRNGSRTFAIEISLRNSRVDHDLDQACEPICMIWRSELLWLHVDWGASGGCAPRNRSISRPDPKRKLSLHLAGSDKSSGQSGGQGIGRRKPSPGLEAAYRGQPDSKGRTCAVSASRLRSSLPRRCRDSPWRSSERRVRYRHRRRQAGSRATREATIRARRSRRRSTARFRGLRPA